MWNLSLKTRLQLPIILLAALIATVLSLLHVHTVVSTTFNEVIDRAQVVAKQVEGFLIERVTEQTSLLQSPPQELTETVQVWRVLVANDEQVPSMLEQTMAATRDSVVEIWIADREGQVLASTNRAREGRNKLKLRTLRAWREDGIWTILRDVLFGEPHERVVEIRLGAGQVVVFEVGVVVSSTLLKESVLPQIRSLGYIAATAILLAVVVAIFVSNLATRPLSRIGEMLDRVGGDEITTPPALSESSAELAAVESKLNVLGQQMRGARQNASQLRNDVHQLLQRLEGAILLFDDNDELILAGGAVERMLGRDRSTMLGRRLADLFSSKTSLGAALQSSAALRRPLNDRVLVYEESSGTATQIALTVEILEQHAPGARRGTLVTMRDAEGRQEIGSQLDIAARLTAINRLTSGVAHEIKNPLNSIALHLEILKAQLDPENQDGHEEIGIIAREIARLDRVVKTFLDFARPVELQLREVDLGCLVEELTELIAAPAAASGVQVKTDLEHGRALVRADQDLMKQAVLNVLMNGIEAMPQGGVLGLSLDRRDSNWQLAISDTGEGIPPEIQNKIFNLYFTTKEKGTGIGLAMTYRIVQLHNAGIEFSTSAGRGTTFRILVPSMATAAASEPEAVSVSPGSGMEA